MEHKTDSEITVVLNVQTVNSLSKQTEIWINQKEVPEQQKQAMLKLKFALKEVLPFLPHTPQHQTNELSLEEDIRKEIKIAGANENG